MARSLEIPSADVDAWTLARGEIDGRPSLLRFRPSLKSFLGDSQYSRRLQVTWSFADDGRNGMPADEDSKAMESLEDRLVVALESARAGVLAFVFTHGGRREWHYYVAESADLDTLINEALAEMPGLPIEFRIDDDAEWAEMTKVLDSVRERSS